jgi:hypothetical protein
MAKAKRRKPISVPSTFTLTDLADLASEKKKQETVWKKESSFLSRFFRDKDDSDSKFIIGGKGAGKSVSSLNAFQTVASYTPSSLAPHPFSNPSTPLPNQSGSGGIGGSGQTITGTPISISKSTQNPWSETKPPATAKKEVFDPEQHRGKFCAAVTIVTNDAGIRAEHTGVLFVRKCGHWKLCGYNGDKLAGGSVGSFEELTKSGRLVVTIHSVIYDDDRIKLDEGDLEIV